jgi:hypothetical protein
MKKANIKPITKLIIEVFFALAAVYVLYGLSLAVENMNFNILISN